MPSRESLKEPAMNPAAGRGPTSGGNLRQTSLIKPFIPPDRPDTVEGPQADPRSGSQAPPPLGATQEPMLQNGSSQSAVANAPIEPVPRPIRWHDPTLDQRAYVKPTTVESSSEPLPSAGQLTGPGVEHRPDAPADSLAAVQSTQPSLSPRPLRPEPSKQASPTPVPSALPTQPAPAMQPPLSMPAMQQTPAAQPSPPAQPRAQLPPGQRYAADKGSKPIESTAKPAAPVPSASAQSSAGVEAKAGSRQWEDQKVKQAALELAHEFQGIKKGKICYSVKTDEWWVVLYEDIGSLYDVKQYTWNRDQEKLEQFLVLKKIGKNRLQEDINERESDKACEPLDFQ